MPSTPPYSQSQQPPPPYAEAIGAAAPAQPPTNPTDEDLLENTHALHPTNTPAPPPFSLTPGTLVIAPSAPLLIQPPIAGARPLYRLLNPLNGHASHNLLIDLPARAPRDRDQLYRLQRPREQPRRRREVVVHRRGAAAAADVVLRKEQQVGGGVLLRRGGYGVFSADEEGRPRVLYQARLVVKKEKGGGGGGHTVWEWHDGGGTLVAVETPAAVAGEMREERRLEIVVALDKRHLDLLVALWVARVYQESQEEGEREDREDERHRKAEQKELDRLEGRPHGVLHDVKEALGIGHGAKRSALGMMSWPTTKADNRINWGGM